MGCDPQEGPKDHLSQMNVLVEWTVLAPSPPSSKAIHLGQGAGDLERGPASFPLATVGTFQRLGTWKPSQQLSAGPLTSLALWFPHTSLKTPEFESATLIRGGKGSGLGWRVGVLS